MNATLDDDKEKLENIRNSAKKFFHRYILLVSINTRTNKNQCGIMNTGFEDAGCED